MIIIDVIIALYHDHWSWNCWPIYNILPWVLYHTCHGYCRSGKKKTQPSSYMAVHSTGSSPAPRKSTWLLPNACRHPNRNGCFVGFEGHNTSPFHRYKKCDVTTLNCGERGLGWFLRNECDSDGMFFLFDPLVQGVKNTNDNYTMTDTDYAHIVKAYGSLMPHWVQIILWYEWC